MSFSASRSVLTAEGAVCKALCVNQLSYISVNELHVCSDLGSLCRSRHASRTAAGAPCSMGRSDAPAAVRLSGDRDRPQEGRLGEKACSEISK